MILTQIYDVIWHQYAAMAFFSAFGARHVHWFIFIHIHIKHSYQLHLHNLSTLNQLRFVRIWVCEIRLPWPKCSGVHSTCSGFQDPELAFLKSMEIDVHLVALSVNCDWGFRFIIAFLEIRFWIRLAVVNCGGRKNRIDVFISTISDEHV